MNRGTGGALRFAEFSDFDSPLQVMIDILGYNDSKRNEEERDRAEELRHVALLTDYAKQVTREGEADH